MNILLVLHVIITALLIGIVLIQKNEGGSSLFASGGSSGGMFNARGTSNMLVKATWVLATLFLGNCILMAYLESNTIKEINSLLVTNEQAAKEQAAVVADDSEDANEEEEYDSNSEKNTTQKDEKASEQKPKGKNGK